jgi:diaminohydroxyphosphoribosylaminopyrimidine deaminase / 5-amino-6-(5-phosphoribosylamino)uracil reductase
MNFTKADEHYMKMALRLAAKGLCGASPNPMVGAVAVQPGDREGLEHVVGRGYHRRYGETHAEVVALWDAGEKARGGVLYVTLEPCNHHGLTPPCTQAVLEAGIKRVVIASRDPNPRVAGHGAAFLAAQGLQVETGLLEIEARRLNEAWFKWVETGLPFVIAKAACSLDGRTATATGESQWITGEASRNFGHCLRRACDVILVGIGTVLADDPQLTARLGKAKAKKPLGNANVRTKTSPALNLPAHLALDGGSDGALKRGAGGRRYIVSPLQGPTKQGADPIRLVLDSRLRLPLTARLLHLDSPAPTWVAATASAPGDKIQALEELGAEVLVLPEDNGRVALKPLLKLLGERRVQSVLVEGGPEVLGAFFDERLVDKFHFFYAPKILGGKDAYPAVAGKGVLYLRDALVAQKISLRRLGQDLLITGYLPKPSQP